MSGSRANAASGSRFLYDPFDAANARIDANERVLAERWEGLEFRLNAIEVALERLEKRLWLAMMGVVGTVLAQGVKYLTSL
ncbi:hypothetical protein [Jannaschia sp. LMIT008]|uniref:GTA head formation protein, RCAP_rcc01685 family n=1 Tax=Jannaschia maritima TaxID=3032585 RepID=UPI0028121033|nr:hypothetical protein [Jannaschia sp. LMIT008]